MTTLVASNQQQTDCVISGVPKSSAVSNPTKRNRNQQHHHFLQISFELVQLFEVGIRAVGLAALHVEIFGTCLKNSIHEVLV